MIDTIKNEELEIKKEDLLKNMTMLRNRVTDMFGPKSFFKGLVQAESHNGVITVNGEQFPIYISAHTLAIDVHPDITDDIFDADNYLSLLTDDDLMWYALVEHLAHQIDLLQEDNIKYNEDLVAANEEIDNLNCKVAEEIKARRGYEESLTQLREDLTAADNEIEGLEESLRAANKQCTDYVDDINKLENENESLKKKLFGGVPTGEQERGTPEDKVVKMDLEAALMQQQIAQLNTRIAQLEEKLHSTETELTTANNANDILRNQITGLKDGKKEAELLAYRLTRGDMHVQFDSMKSLEHENAVLKNENADLNQKLYQKEDEDDLRKRIAEYAQKYDEVLNYNKKLRQEITKLRVETGRSVADSVEPHVVTADDEMKYTITRETMDEVTTRVKDLEAENDRLRQEISKFRVQLNSYSGVTVVDNEDMQHTITKETMAELTARINELESINENLRKENEDFTSIQEAHLETTAKFAEYKDRQKRLYKHFKNLAEMIEDLMELG